MALDRKKMLMDVLKKQKEEIKDEPVGALVVTEPVADVPKEAPTPATAEPPKPVAKQDDFSWIPLDERFDDVAVAFGFKEATGDTNQTRVGLMKLLMTASPIDVMRFMKGWPVESKMAMILRDPHKCPFTDEKKEKPDFGLVFKIAVDWASVDVGIAEFSWRAPHQSAGSFGGKRGS